MRLAGAGSIRRNSREWVLRHKNETRLAETPTHPPSRQVKRREALLLEKIVDSAKRREARATKRKSK